MSVESLYLSLVSNSPHATPLVLVDGPPYTPWTLAGVRDMGMPKWQHTFSGQRGTQGRRAVSGSIEDRTVKFGLISQDQADKDELAATYSALEEVVDDMRRFGGRIEWRELAQTNRQAIDVTVAGIELGEWSANEFSLRDAVRPVITATGAPYIVWDPFDFTDDFTADNMNAGRLLYTASAGALTNVSPVAGELTAVANLTTENRLIYTGPGYTFHDCEAQVFLTPGATITDLLGGVILSWIDDLNYLAVYIHDNGTNSRLRIDKVVGGTKVNLSSTNLAGRMVAGDRVGIRARLEGNIVTAGYFAGGMRFIDAADTQASITLTADGLATFGGHDEGKPGIIFTPQASDAFLSAFVVRPYTYRDSVDDQTIMRGIIPGDAPAPADLWISSPGGGQTYAFGMLAWAPRREWNRLQNGGFDLGFGSAPWSAAGATGITGAATSQGTAVAGKFGENCGYLVTPATANTGTVHPIYRLFKKGVEYTFEVWIKRANSATHNVRVRFGISGDVSSSAGAALSDTWTKHVVEWTPAASTQRAYVCIEQTAATVAAVYFDGAVVYEGGSGVGRPTYGRHPEGTGGHPPCAPIRACDYVAKSSNLTVTTNAGAVAGYTLADSSVSAGGENYYARYAIDPSLIDPDDYSGGEVGVEVWARLQLSTAFTGGAVCTVSALSLSEDVAVYTAEHGSYGKTLVLPSTGNDRFGLHRLGRLSLGAADHLPWLLNIGITVAAGTNAQLLAIDTIYVVPSRSRARNMIALSTAGYPYLIPGTGSQLKIVRSADLSGFYSTVVENAKSGAAAGLHGSPIELPPGKCDLLWVMSREVPEGTYSTTGDASVSNPFHLAVTPRSKWIRGT